MIDAAQPGSAAKMLLIDLIITPPQTYDHLICMQEHGTARQQRDQKKECVCSSLVPRLSLTPGLQKHRLLKVHTLCRRAVIFTLIKLLASLRVCGGSIHGQRL